MAQPLGDHSQGGKRLINAELVLNEASEDAPWGSSLPSSHLWVGTLSRWSTEGAAHPGPPGTAGVPAEGGWQPQGVSIELLGSLLPWRGAGRGCVAAVCAGKVCLLDPAKNNHVCQALCCLLRAVLHSPPQQLWVPPTSQRERQVP